MRHLLPLLTCLAFALASSTDAEAHKRRHRHKHVRKPPPPPVRVVVPPVRVVVKTAVRVPPQPCPGVNNVWVAGHPGHGGRWVPGHCEYVGPAPRSGWTYVSGYWNGRIWVTGFWRPSVRVGFTWVGAHVNDQDEYVAGYWEPEGQSPEGMMWRPGYFDGTDWVAGGWVPVETYEAYDENGELAFFAVGDGHVEELAIPAADIDTGDLGTTDPGAVAAEAGPSDTDDPAALQERHASVPD